MLNCRSAVMAFSNNTKRARVFFMLANVVVIVIYFKLKHEYSKPRCFTGITIIVSKRGYQLDVVLTMPNEFHNITLGGLFGNFNDIPSDDFVSASGGALNANASEELIFRNFGETCELIFPFLVMTSCYC